MMMNTIRTTELTCSVEINNYMNKNNITVQGVIIEEIPGFGVIGFSSEEERAEVLEFLQAFSYEDMVELAFFMSRQNITSHVNVEVIPNLGLMGFTSEKDRLHCIEFLQAFTSRK